MEEGSEIIFLFFLSFHTPQSNENVEMCRWAREGEFISRSTPPGHLFLFLLYILLFMFRNPSVYIVFEMVEWQNGICGRGNEKE